MLTSRPRQPVNLTAGVELSGDGGRIGQVLASAHLSFSLHGDEALGSIPQVWPRDSVYLIISGYGVLRCSDGAPVEFTAGDVVLVPAGAPHTFEELGPKFKSWRIEAVPAATPGDAD
jgi:mannose-6-phosphate isomerase-like protein (cupin superfamily)